MCLLRDPYGSNHAFVRFAQACVLCCTSSVLEAHSNNVHAVLIKSLTSSRVAWRNIWRGFVVARFEQMVDGRDAL